MPGDRPLPSAVPDEMVILATVFSRSAFEVALSTGLLPDDFYDTTHRVIFAELYRRYSKAEPFDPELVLRDLERAGKLTPDQVGEFINRETCPCTPANIPHYCKPILEAAARRRIIEQAYTEIERAHNPEAKVEVSGPAWIIPDLSPARFFETEPEPFEFIIPGLLARGIVGFIYGAGGAYKSLAALWLVILRAIFEYDNRQAWLDRFPLGAGGRSIFFSAEDVEIDLHHRVRNIISGIHEARPDVPLEAFQKAISENCLIVSREQWKQDGELFLVDSDGKPTLKTRPVIQLIRDFGADLAVFETYSRIAPVDEIDNRTAARVVGTFEEIRDQTGATIPCVAHSSKAARGGKSDINDQNGLRGAGALLDNARWGLSFRALSRGESGADQIEVTNSKSFRCKRADKFTLEVNYPGFRLVDQAELKPDVFDTVVDYVRDHPGCKLRQIRETLKRSNGTITQAIKDAVDEGLLLEPGKGCSAKGYYANEVD